MATVAPRPGLMPGQGRSSPSRPLASLGRDLKAEGELGAMQGPHCNHLPSPREAWRLLLPPRGVHRAVATFLGRALASHSSVLGPALLQSKPGSEKAWGGGGGRTPHSGLEPAVLRGLGTHPQGLASPSQPPHLTAPPPGRSLRPQLSGLLRGTSGTQGPRLHVWLRPQTSGTPQPSVASLGLGRGPGGS